MQIVFPYVTNDTTISAYIQISWSMARQKIVIIEYSVIVCTICCRGASSCEAYVCFVLIVVVKFDAKRWIEILYPKRIVYV